MSTLVVSGGYWIGLVELTRFHGNVVGGSFAMGLEVWLYEAEDVLLERIQSVETRGELCVTHGDDVVLKQMSS
jgi:hypothetical protein